jgi:thioredoxin-like negative regulator of GroEL
MRLVVVAIGCVLFLGPIAATLGYKEYQRYQAQQELQMRAGGQWHTRGEVLFFNASWCGPCRQMKPIVASLRAEGYHMRDVDVDTHRPLAEKYSIHAVPTFVFVENGREVNRFSGGTSPQSLKSMLSAPAYNR